MPDIHRYDSFVDLQPDGLCLRSMPDGFIHLWGEIRDSICAIEKRGSSIEVSLDDVWERTLE